MRTTRPHYSPPGAGAAQRRESSAPSEPSCQVALHSARLPQADSSLRLVARAGRDQVRNGEPVRVGHLPRQRGVPVVQPGAHSRLLQHPERIPGMGAASLDARHHHLLRGEPGGEVTPVVLEEDAQEALEAPHQRPVEHHRPVPAAGTIREAELEPLGQHRIHLDRPALPGAPQAVAERELQLGPVKRRPLRAGGSRRGLRRAPRRRAAPPPGPRRRRRRGGSMAGPKATSTSSKPSAAYSARRLPTKRRSSSGTCSSRQKTCPSSWEN